MSGVDGCTDTSLRKPERPKMPRATLHGRSNIGAGREFADQAAFDAAYRKYSADLRHYDDVLYPEYRSAKKRAARPADDGSRAIQRRRDNPTAAANHVDREREARSYYLEREEQATFLRLCSSCRDAAIVDAVQQWADANRPDGTDEWWLQVQRVAHAAQSILLSYNQLAVLTHPRCWSIDLAAVEEAWELSWLTKEIGDAARAAWAAAGSPYPMGDWTPAAFAPRRAELKRRLAQPMHKRDGSAWTSASFKSRQQLADAGFNVACKHARCCDVRGCWRYDTDHRSWSHPNASQGLHDAKGWPIAGARFCGVIHNRCQEAESRTDGSRHSLEDAGQRLTAPAQPQTQDESAVCCGNEQEGEAGKESDAGEEQGSVADELCEDRAVSIEHCECPRL
eukprot:CAMPEP_0181226796 /NCGR_PEP_ID=MMETSP1096-20121128/32445_1 /TAXON_ID=156174 ORGANISM="Chrysochromulina ericina, Strain CCMP281" /NCGR_SAMPLE_ID=MMETSP1096 /ASSEMBLY_ACC=CAM_ASM_000453 /LENGTH=394 /DNA_ID=CAMNT_0023320157 /DNA_START=280 /DNA_END=1461 /DNA_ORIENTATION=+